MAREEPLEWFFCDFPADEEFVGEGWLIEPHPRIKEKAGLLQRHFAHVSWLKPIPDHFLHVWFGGTLTLGERPLQWRGTGAFEVSYERVNCFHSAVVVEVHAPRLNGLIERSDVDASTFLPHMTIAVTTEAHGPADLRELLIPLRDRRLGRATATEAKRVRFPAARTTLLQPWEVVEAIRF